MLSLGRFCRYIDHKLRVSLPPEILAATGKNIIIARSPDGCLFLFSLKEFERTISSVLRLPLENTNARNRRREKTAAAFPAMLDNQRRVTLPPSLAEYASLRRGERAVISGMGNCFELWSESVLRDFEKKNGPQTIVSQAEEIVKKVQKK